MPSQYLPVEDDQTVSRQGMLMILAILNRISHENQTPPARQENQRKYAQLPLVE
jgi:hypothetical protein